VKTITEIRREKTMRIQFDYGWYDDDKRIIRYAARDNWTWKDYHAVVHVSLYAIQSQPHTVHSVIDFSTGTRPKFPSGIAAHARTFGKPLTPNLSGNAVVLGVPPDAMAKLNVSTAGTITTPDGTVHFVKNSEELETILHSWLTES
jgi:hypothetical protein